MGPDCRTCLSRSRHGLPDSCLGQCLCSGDLQVPGAPRGIPPLGWGRGGGGVSSSSRCHRALESRKQSLHLAMWCLGPEVGISIIYRLFRNNHHC